MSVLFRFIFFSCLIFQYTQVMSSQDCLTGIQSVLEQGHQLRQSGQYFLAIQKYSIVETLSCSTQEKAWAKLGNAQSLYKLYENTLAGEILESLDNFTVDEKIRNKANLLRAWYKVEYRKKLDPVQQQQFIEYEKSAERMEKYDLLKKPWLAGSLSAVIPGAGQIYNGNYQSATFSFIINALLLMTALELEKEGHSISALTAGVFFSITYTGNILSSVQSAHTINQNYLKPFLDEQRKKNIPDLEL